MRIYTCKPEWEAMLTCIYEAFNSKLGHKNIRLLREPIDQYAFFDEYVHIEPDSEKANKVIASINEKLSPYVYRELAITSMAYEEDALDNIYHVLILGFKYGKDVLNMFKFRDIMRNYEIRQRVGREASRFQEFLRFNRLGDTLVAHFEPKSRVAEYLGPVFMDRMPSENFIIVDDIHYEAVIHPSNETYYMQKLTQAEMDAIKNSEEHTDEYTDLWKIFFDTIAIRERTNDKCQNTHAPKWARLHMVEFS